jgi:hypothetical protein
MADSQEATGELPGFFYSCRRGTVEFCKLPGFFYSCKRGNVEFRKLPGFFYISRGANVEIVEAPCRPSTLARRQPNSTLAEAIGCAAKTNGRQKGTIQVAKAPCRFSTLVRQQAKSGLEGRAATRRSHIISLCACRRKHGLQGASPMLHGVVPKPYKRDDAREFSQKTARS